MEIIEDTKEYLPTVVTTGRLLSKASLGNNVAKNNGPIENEIPKFDLLLKSISREIKLFEEIYKSKPPGSNDNTPSTVYLEGVEEGNEENTDPNSEYVIADDGVELTGVSRN